MVKGDANKEKGAERVPDDLEAKRAANRERVKDGQNERNVDSGRFSAGGTLDREINEKWASGKSAKQIIEELNAQGQASGSPTSPSSSPTAKQSSSKSQRK